MAEPEEQAQPGPSKEPAQKGQKDLSAFGFFKKPTDQQKAEEQKKRRIQQQSKYDQKKRKRGFQDTWIELFPGLRYKKNGPAPKKS